jgi:hypothetical protein
MYLLFSTLMTGYGYDSNILIHSFIACQLTVINKRKLNFKNATI